MIPHYCNVSALPAGSVSVSWVCLYYCYCYCYCRASEVLESSGDPRAQYIKWYRAGQERIAREVLCALDSAISEQEQYDENSSVE